MGQWHIGILGHGIHDNGNPNDVDSLLKEFVDNLRSRGHEVHSAQFTVGTSRDVTASLKDNVEVRASVT